MLTKTREISNRDDVIDSRDINERIEELETEVSDAFEEYEEAKKEIEEEPLSREAWLEVEQAEGSPIWESNHELLTLKSLAAEGEGCAPDWSYGATMIRDSYFESYARELAEDLGLIKSDLAWPYTCIDWEQAASQLQGDYTSIDFDGVTYWVR